MRKQLFALASLATVIVFFGTGARAQEYKIRQSPNVVGMKSESTVYVKGMRKRTENSGMMSMALPPVVIEQCDLQRYVKLNNKKKLYYVEPFGKEDVIDEDAKPATVKKSKPVVTPKKKTLRKKVTLLPCGILLLIRGEKKTKWLCSPAYLDQPKK